MIRPLLILASIAIAIPQEARAGTATNVRIERFAQHIAEASNRFGIPQSWVRQVMRLESGGETELGGRPIRSSAGAMGLMQLMPGTWREMRQAHGLGLDPDEPRDNILAGTAYLRAMYDRFGYPGLFAAYNAGPARYAEHLRQGRRLPAETIAYVASIAGRRLYSTPLPAAARPGLFAIAQSRAAKLVTPASSPLFVPLSAGASE